MFLLLLLLVVVLVFLSALHKLELSEKRESPLRKFLHKTGLRKGIFLNSNCWGRAQPIVGKATPEQVVLVYIRKSWRISQ